MFRATVLYPAKADSKFDFDYYLGTHIPLLVRLFKPHGLVRVEVDRGIAGGRGGPPPFVAITHLYWNTLEDRARAGAAAGKDVGADLPNFTDLEPDVVVGEINEV